MKTFISEYLQREADLYINSLIEFSLSNNLHPFIAPPVDHIGIKMKNKDHYDLTLNSILPYCIQGIEVDLHNRKIADLILSVPVDLGALGEVSILEIMQPRPEKENIDLVGFDHIEVFNPKFEWIEEGLKANNTEYTHYENIGHRALVCRINDKGQEIKFTDKRLESLIEEQIKSGVSKIIK